MKSITTSDTPIHFNAAAYEALQRQLREKVYSSIFILVDEHTHQHCLPVFISALSGIQPREIIKIVPGELHKNINTCIRVWETLSEKDADRQSLLINLGGGVVTDLGGFVASAYKRGIDFINVPTSLLAMVDASVGGKTGIDLGPLKNQIGVIRQPEMVLVITAFLSTLNERQLRSGFAEMLKHGLIRDASYWEALKSLKPSDPLDTRIHESITIKNEVVRQDPEERNLRKILNFGHTLGHAIESYYMEAGEAGMMLHGEAIAAGMVLESYLSHQLTGLDIKQLDDIKSVFMERYPKAALPLKDMPGILELLKHDKKNSYGNINFVLLKNIGEPVIDCKVPVELFPDAFAYYSE